MDEYEFQSADLYDWCFTDRQWSELVAVRLMYTDRSRARDHTRAVVRSRRNQMGHRLSVLVSCGIRSTLRTGHYARQRTHRMLSDRTANVGCNQRCVSGMQCGITDA